MSSSLIGGVAGAAVGFFIGGPVGMQYGFMLGSMAGGLLFPPKGPDGPRLGDLSVQVSSYGMPIPLCWGTVRVAGNVIWAADLVEHAKEEGGKGGPEYTTYSYTCSFAVSLGDRLALGPIVGVRRIWAYGKLIYDASAGNTGPQYGFTCTSMVVYPGSGTQLPDPTIEAHEGHSPAYLHQAYVVFADMDLSKFQNALPRDMTFEVVTAGQAADRASVVFGERYVSAGTTFQSDLSSDGLLWVSTIDGHPNDDMSAPVKPLIKAYDPITHALIHQIEVKPETTYDAYGAPLTAVPIQGYGICYGGKYYIGRGRPGAVRWPTIRCEDCAPGDDARVENNYIHAITVDETGVPVPLIDDASSGQFQNASYWPSVPVRVGGPLGLVYMVGGNGVSGGFGVGFTFSTNYQINDKKTCCKGGPTSNFDGRSITAPGIALKAVAMGDDSTAIFGPGASGFFYLSINGTPPGVEIPGNQSIMPAAVWDEARDKLWMFAGPDYNTLYDQSGAPAGYAFPATTEYRGNFVHAVGIDKRTGYLRIIIGGAPAKMVLFNPDTLTVVETRTLDFNAGFGGVTGKLWDFPEIGKAIYSNGYELRDIFYGAALTSQPVPLSQIVTDLSTLVGLTAADIDVSALTHQVQGFTVARPGAARSALEQLMMAYQFDVAPRGGKNRFVPRGGKSVRAIGADDLALHEPGADAPAALALTREDEVALPRTLTIKYANPTADYQISAQSAIRQTVRASGEQTHELPLVLTDAQAKGIADAAMYSAWTARTQARWNSSLKHADLEPTDVVTVEDKNLYITKRTLRAGNVIDFEGVIDIGRVFGASGAIPAVAEPVAQTIPVIGNTALELMDIPMLRDQDDDAGFYIAASGYSGVADWPGCVVYKSSDGGASWAEYMTLTTPCTAGAAVNALGSYDYNLFDEGNSLTVRLRSGTLASITELAVLNGGNAALVGGEVIQFRTATLNADGTYTLTGLLRGRRGSPTTGHAIGDRFVLLTESTLRRAPSATAEIGLERLYKAVTFGKTLATTQAIAFTNTAQGLECLSPVLPGGGRDAAGNLTIAWTRRTRIGGEWRDYVDASLGEPAQAYEVEVYASSAYATVKRTLTGLSTPSASYTSAQQVADFGANQATVYVRIYQLSATVGRGAYLQGAV